MARKNNSIKCSNLAIVLRGLAKYAVEDTSIGEDEITVVDLADFLETQMEGMAIGWEKAKQEEEKTCDS